MRLNLAAACLAVTLLPLAGCRDTTGAYGAPAPSVSAPPKGPPSGQSLWHLVDGNGRTGQALPDSDPDVAAIKALVAAQSAVVDHRSGRTVALSAAKENVFYTTRLATELRSAGYYGRVTSLFQDNGLSTEPVDIGWYASTIGSNRTSAQVVMDSTFEFATAKSAYLKANGLATNTAYTQHRVIGLRKVDGKWLIDSLRKYPLTRKPAAP